MSKISTINKEFKKSFPLDLQEEWDFSGWLFKRNLKKVTKVVVAIDLTTEVLQMAIKENAELIITHHPHVFGKLDDHLKDTLKKKLYMDLKRSKISLYSAHTNYDNNPKGMPYSIEKYTSIPLLHVSKALSVIHSDDGVVQLAKDIKEWGNLADVRLYKNNDEAKIKAAFVAGGAGGMVPHVSDSGYNTFITGDFKWNEIIEAKDRKLNIIHISHGIEEVFVTHMADYMSEKFPQLKIIKHYENYNGQIL